MTDQFASYQPGLTSPAENAQAVTPSDSVALANASRALYVGTSGNLSVVMLSGDVVTFPGVQGGMVYPLRVLQVRATGTTAGGLVAIS